MIRTLSSLVALGLFSAGAPLLACGGHEESAVREIDVQALAALLSEKNAVTVLDVNNDEVRGKYGVIPGARLLSDYAKYDLAQELPQDKTAALVFYCGGPKCNAAPKAAWRAWA